MTFKRQIGLLVLVSMVMLVGACTTVPPGHVGIQVNMSGADKGVSNLTLQTGRVFYNPITEQVFSYPTFVQTVVWTANKNEGNAQDESITFTGKGNLIYSVDVSMSYQLVSDKVPNFYVKFRNDDLSAFTYGYLHNQARDEFNEAAGAYELDNIMGDNSKFIADVRDRLQKSLDPIGVQIAQFGLIGAPRPPAAITQAINDKFKATQDAQRVENELRATTAQAAKAVAQAEGEAKSNAIKNASLTPQIIEWERLKLTEQAISKWNGLAPTINGGGGSPLNFLYQMPQSAK